MNRIDKLSARKNSLKISLQNRKLNMLHYSEHDFRKEKQR